VNDGARRNTLNLVSLRARRRTVKPFEQRELHGNLTIRPELRILNQKVTQNRRGPFARETASIVRKFAETAHAANAAIGANLFMVTSISCFQRGRALPSYMNVMGLGPRM
jgi:hypothetical protein